MQERFTYLTDKQLTGLYACTLALEHGKRSVEFSNECLCNLLRVRAVHNKRVRQYVDSFAPFLSRPHVIIHPGKPKTVILLLPGETKTTNPLFINKLPTAEKMEAYLRLNVCRLEIEREELRVVKTLEIQDRATKPYHSLTPSSVPTSPNP